MRLPLLGRGAVLSVVCVFEPVDPSDATESYADGPALRATAIITYATHLYNSGNTTYVTNTLWPIIELDLNYVAGNWNQSTSVRFLPTLYVCQTDT